MANIVKKSSSIRKATPLASRVLQDYDYWLIKNYGKSGTYLTNAKTFLKTVKPGGTVDSQLNSYAEDMSLTIQSFLRRFGRFLKIHGIDFVHNDLNEKRLPIGNIYVKIFIASRQDRLQGEFSSTTYTTILNGYFDLIGNDLRAFNKRSAEKYVLAPALSDYTKRLYRSVLKAFCDWALIYQGNNDKDLSHDQKAVRKGLKLISPQSLREISSIKVKTSNEQIKRYHKDSLTEKQRLRLLKVCTTPGERAIVSLMAWNGLRKMEVPRLTITDCNFKQRKLAVWGKGKSAKSKVQIKFFDTPMNEVIKHIKRSGLKSGKLFPGLTNRNIDELIKDKFQRLKLLSGRVKFTSHSLRHTAGQIMYDKKIPLEFIQMTLRHAKMETTLVYAQKAIDRRYFKTMPGNV